jgi:hypothetical protein
VTHHVDAIDWAFGGKGVDDGQIIQTYGVEESIEAQRLYSADRISGHLRKWHKPRFREY